MKTLDKDKANCTCTTCSFMRKDLKSYDYKSQPQIHVDSTPKNYQKPVPLANMVKLPRAKRLDIGDKENQNLNNGDNNSLG